MHPAAPGRTTRSPTAAMAVGAIHGGPRGHGRSHVRSRSKLNNLSICIPCVIWLGSSPSPRPGRLDPPGANPPGKEPSVLVLSRKLGERIIIGDRIVVTVARLANGQVRLGIEAPREIAVFREEIEPRLHPPVQAVV